MDSGVGDPSVRLRLLDFAITHCPPEELASLLQAKQVLELQVSAVEVTSSFTGSC